MSNKQTNRYLAKFIKWWYNTYAPGGRNPDATEYARWMKQLKPLVTPKKGYTVHEVNTLKEVITDLARQGVVMYSPGILLVTGLVAHYTSNRGEYQKLIEWFKAHPRGQADEVPRGFEW